MDIIYFHSHSASNYLIQAYSRRHPALHPTYEERDELLDEIFILEFSKLRQASDCTVRLSLKRLPCSLFICLSVTVHLGDMFLCYFHRLLFWCGFVRYSPSGGLFVLRASPQGFVLFSLFVLRASPQGFVLFWSVRFESKPSGSLFFSVCSF